ERRIEVIRRRVERRGLGRAPAVTAAARQPEIPAARAARAIGRAPDPQLAIGARGEPDLRARRRDPVADEHRGFVCERRSARRCPTRGQRQKEDSHPTQYQQFGSDAIEYWIAFQCPFVPSAITNVVPARVRYFDPQLTPAMLLSRRPMPSPHVAAVV